MKYWREKQIATGRDKKTGRHTMSGLAEIRRNIRKVCKEMKRNCRPAVTQLVTEIQHASMDRTPIRTGNLKGSHRSRIYKGSTGQALFGVVYLLAAYALFVHEAKPDTQFRSPWPRGRKFLERAINDNYQRLRVMLKTWLTK